MTEKDSDTPGEDELRSPSQVARRCLVLYAVLAGGHKESREDLTKWLQREGLWDAVSPDEATFLKSTAPTREEVINATWRAEAIFALLWAMGRIESLTSPTSICDIPSLRSMLPDLFTSTSVFVSTAALRPEEEIWEAHEATYQAHWAVRDAQLNQKTVPNGYHAGVVHERHYALNWLTDYCGQEWDDITTDT